MIAQMNFATALAPLDHPIMAEFMDNLDRINALAEASPGFVWRLKDDTGNATSIDILTDPKAILNVSVWQSVDDLYSYAFRTDHQYFVKKRAHWFVPSTKRSFVMWTLSEGEAMPTPQEAFARLRHLEQNGPTAFAFDWKTAKEHAI